MKECRLQVEMLEELVLMASEELEIQVGGSEPLDGGVAEPFGFHLCFSLYVPELTLRNPFRMIAPLKTS